MEKYTQQYISEMKETKSDSTVRGHRSTLNNFIKQVDATEPVEIMVREIVRYRENEYNKKKASTVNTQLKRVKLFFDWCVEQGYIDDSPAKDVKLLTEGEQLPKWLTEQQEDLLLKAVNRKYLGINVRNKSYREKAMIFLMLKAGLRVGEVVQLKWDEIQIIGNSGKVLVRGKGQQQRTVPLITDVVEVLKQYKNNHEIKGEYVFDSQRSDSVTVRTVQQIVAGFKEEKQRDVNLRELTPHVLRHTFAHTLAQSGMQLEAIARVMGHIKENGEPNIQQTIRYTKTSDDEIGQEMNDILSLR